MATSVPLTRGTTRAKIRGNHPSSRKEFSFFPLVIPMSRRKTAKKPLKMSVVKGLIPSAWASLARKPMARLPRIRITLPLVMACLSREVQLACGSPRFFPNMEISSTPMTIDGASISAMTATMCPPKGILCISKKETAVTKVTALTEP